MISKLLLKPLKRFSIKESVNQKKAIQMPKTSCMNHSPNFGNFPLTNLASETPPPALCPYLKSHLLEAFKQPKQATKHHQTHDD